MSLNTRDAPPLVTVVVPVYNTERYVGETLRSVIAQTWKNLEIIVVIDGSTDGSLEICRGFDDGRIRIVEQENQGLAAARNTGIRESTGTYIGFIDSDDTWWPEKVEKHVRHLEDDPVLGVSFSYSALMDEDSRPMDTYQKAGTSAASFSDFYVKNVMGNGSNAVLRKEVFTGRRESATDFPQLGGFLCELRRAQDYELWSRIACLTKWKMACLLEPMVNYRINRSGLSANLQVHRQYYFLAMARVACFAPDAAEHWRTRAVAHTYWHQARTAAIQYLPQAGIRAVKLAVWYDWRSINGNHVAIALAALFSRLLPEKAYFPLQRLAARAWGALQKLQMKVFCNRVRHGLPTGQERPAAEAVKKPEAYACKDAMPNLFFPCHRHRFMYLGISSNASTSMRHCIRQEEDGDDGPDDPDAGHRRRAPVKDRSIDRRDRAELARFGEYLKFTVFRDPVSRFLSAYHNRVLFSPNAHPFYTRKRLEGMGLEQFIRVTESILKIDNPLHIDAHLRPQSWCYEPSDVDFIVPIEHLQAFLRAKFGIVRDRRANTTELPRIRPTGEQIRRIRELYACDYRIEPNWSP